MSKKEKRKQVAANTYEELLDKLIVHYGKLSEPKTLESILEEFLEDKGRTKKQATISRDRRTWQRYLAGTDLVRIPLERLEGYEIKVWIEDLIKAESLSVHEYSNLKTIVNQMLKYAARKYIEKDPLRGIEIDTNMLKQDRKAPGKTQRYVKKEMERVMAVAWEDFNARKHRIHQLSPLAFLFMFCTAMRISEACAVKWSDIEGNIIIVQRMLSSETGMVEENVKMGHRGFGPREVDLIKAARDILDIAKKHQQLAGVYNPEGYIFSMRPLEPLPYSTLAKCFYNFCKKAGVTAKSSHKARKTYGSTLIEKGYLEIASNELGHLHSRTTLKSYSYDASEDDERLQIIEDALADNIGNVISDIISVA